MKNLVSIISLSFLLVFISCGVEEKPVVKEKRAVRDTRFDPIGVEKKRPKEEKRRDTRFDPIGVEKKRPKEEKRKLDDGRELEDSGLIAEENEIGIAPGQIWVFRSKNPFYEPHKTEIVAVKNGYVQYRYVDGSSTLWSNHIYFFRDHCVRIK